MLDPAVMWTIAVAIVLLPFAVTYALNGTHQSDARGRRVNRRWQGRSLVPPGHRLPGADAAQDHHEDAHTT